MIIKNKKYLVLKNPMFYAELESQRLTEELQNGWQVDKVGWLGYYRLKPVEKEEGQMVIDFFPDEKNQCEEYLELYEASGWSRLACYRKRYFIFKGPSEVESVYSDEESYVERIKKEQTLFLLGSFKPFLVGMIGIYLLSLPLVKEFFISKKILLVSLQFFSLLGILYLVISIILLLYYKLMYLKRPSFFKEPKRFAKKQRFLRDLLLTMLIGGIIGAFIGGLFDNFNLF